MNLIRVDMANSEQKTREQYKPIDVSDSTEMKEPRRYYGRR